MNTSENPFYAHSKADFIVVEQGREILGRIAILHNQNYCIYNHDETAFFYYFECVDDLQAASSLFDAAEDWARKRKLKHLLGPHGFFNSDSSGLLIKGYDAIPATGVTYNLPYYQKLIDSCGFVKEFDQLSGILEKQPDTMIHEVAKKVLDRGNFQILHFKNISEIRPWMSKIEELDNTILSNYPYFCPPTFEESALFSTNILQMVDPKLITLIIKDEAVAGIILALPNVNGAIKRCHGHLFPFGWVWISQEKKHPKIVDFLKVGILPEYQGMGGNVLLFSELDKFITNQKIKNAEVVQVMELNLRNKSDLQNLGIRVSKIHRIYRKNLS